MNGDVESLKDEIAMLEYRRGDESALEGLIRRWQRRVFAYVRAMVTHPDAAWDVSQETWLAVIKALRGTAEIRHFRAWLYRVARNKAVSYLRKKGRQRELIDSEGGDPAEIPAAVRGPTIAAADAQVVREALMALPLPQRETVALFYIEDMSLKEIAGILEIPVGTVQSRLYHGRRKMKAALSVKGFRP